MRLVTWGINEQYMQLLYKLVIRSHELMHILDTIFYPF